MNVTNINDKREFNEDGTYNGAYGDMVQVPKSLYTFMIQSSQQILPSINKHVIAYNMKKAKENAADPKTYRYYVNQAALYKKHNINNPDVDQRIRQSLSDPELRRVEDKIKRMRNSPTLKTDIGMKEYQNLHIERERRYNVLEENEHTKYQNFINNPSNNIVPQPESMKDTPYHSRTIKSFLAKHPDLMQHDISGNLYVLGKKVSDNPKQGGKILHWITHDYSDLSQIPHGTSAVITALRKKGFNINDIGNTYLREHLQKKVQQRRQQRQQTPRGATATPGRTPQQRDGIPSSFLTPPSTIHSSSSLISTPATREADKLSHSIRDSTDRISRLTEKYKHRLPTSSGAHGSSTPARPSAPSTDDPRRKRKRTTLFDDGRRDDYNLRTRHRKKSKDDDDDDRPKKHAKRKTKRQ